jgi:hypothetical protein
VPVVVVLGQVPGIVVTRVGEPGIVFRIVLSGNAVEPRIVPVAVTILDVRRFPEKIMEPAFSRN